MIYTRRRERDREGDRVGVNITSFMASLCGSYLHVMGCFMYGQERRSAETKAPAAMIEL